LEQFIDEVLARPPAEQPAPNESWSVSDRARIAEIAASVFSRYESHGLTGRPIFWQRDKKHILDDLERFLAEDNIHRLRHGTRPVAAELAFGLPGATLDTVALNMPDGRSVRFRGKADRVDIAANGALHVVDYKTGKADDYRELSEVNPDLRGRRLQLVVYGQAARSFRHEPDVPVLAEYWFVSARGRFEHIGYQVTPELLERVGETIGTMVAGIEAGVFPAHPSASSSTRWVECAYCDPDALGAVELRRSFERKSVDPAMALFVGLAYGEGAPDA
jgi:ATP-dependent helicase/nuclease subunit B